MIFRHSVGYKTIILLLLIAAARGLTNQPRQYDQSIPASNTNPLVYRRPPVQYLDTRRTLHGDSTGQRSLPTGDRTSNLGKNQVQAIPYSSRNGQLPSYSNAITRRGDDKQGYGENLVRNDFSSNHGSNSKSYPNSEMKNTPSKSLPVFNASPNNNIQFHPDSQSHQGLKHTSMNIYRQPSVQPVNSKYSNTAQPTYSRSNQPQQYHYDSGNTDQNIKSHPSYSRGNLPQPYHYDSGNNGQYIKSQPSYSRNQPQQYHYDSENNDQSGQFGRSNYNTGTYFNPLNAIEKQTHNGGDYRSIPILEKGFVVPTTYNPNLRSGISAQTNNNLYTAANPGHNAKQLIGSYVPRNDFVNPQLFNIPAADKHTIVNRIFGGFHDPLPGGSSRHQFADAGSRNNLFNRNVNRGINSGNEQLDNFQNKNINSIGLSNNAYKKSSPGNLNPNSQKFGRQNANFDPSDTGLKNLGTFPASKDPANSNQVLVNTPIVSAQKPQTININLKNKGQLISADSIDIGSAAKLESNAFGNRLDFPSGINDNNNKLYTGTKDLSSIPTTRNYIQTRNPKSSDNQQRSISPYDFNSLRSFDNIGVFANPNSGNYDSFDGVANGYKTGNSFMNQPAPTRLFSDFSQADTPLTVDSFRSRNLIKDENLGKTDYDRTRPTTLTLLGDTNINDIYGAGSVRGTNVIRVQPRNNHIGGNDNESGHGGFKKIGGRTVTTGGSYDNVSSQNQGYSNNFDDRSNVDKRKPSSLDKQKEFKNVYQTNDGYNRAGSYSDGNDFADKYSFKDGDSANDQRSSSSQNENNYRKSYENQQQMDDKESYNNADGYNNDYINGRKYDLTDGYTDNVNYKKQNSGTSKQGFNDGYQRGVANIGSNLANQRDTDLYANLPRSISKGLPQESNYKPFDVNKPVFGGTVLSKNSEYQ